MRIVLLAAAVYNVLWGAFVVLFPFALFRVLEMELPNYPQIWQCVGMIVGVYGVGYAAAALDPLRHWPIVLVGLLGKIFGPIGFLFAAVRGELPPSFGLTLLTNDLIWWAPFALILLRSCQANKTTKKANAQVMAQQPPAPPQEVAYRTVPPRRPE